MMISMNMTNNNEDANGGAREDRNEEDREAANEDEGDANGDIVRC